MKIQAMLVALKRAEKQGGPDTQDGVGQTMQNDDDSFDVAPDHSFGGSEDGDSDDPPVQKSVCPHCGK